MFNHVNAFLLALTLTTNILVMSMMIFFYLSIAVEPLSGHSREPVSGIFALNIPSDIFETKSTTIKSCLVRPFRGIQMSKLNLHLSSSLSTLKLNYFYYVKSRTIYFCDQKLSFFVITRGYVY